MRHVISLSRVLLCVMTLAALLSAPLAVNHAPSLEQARLDSLSLLGFSQDDICGTGDAADGHRHCESCLSQAVDLGGYRVTLWAELACLRASRKIADNLTQGRLVKSAHPIRAPPLV